MKSYGLFWFTLLILALLFITRALCTTQKPVEKAIEEYLTDYLKIYPQRLGKAIELIPSLVEISKQHKIDPFLLATTISKESSWVETAYNKSKGERGLTQVHGVAAKGFDLTHSIGQIRAGANWLQRSINACNGSEIGGINRYMTGKRCKPVCKQAVTRFNLYQTTKKTYCPTGCY